MERKMKTVTKKTTYEDAISKKMPSHKPPKKPDPFLNLVIRTASEIDMRKTDFSYTKRRMELVGDEPCLILMNHSSFIDMKIASRILFPKRYCIVCSADAFVGKDWLMRFIGCIPTLKFVPDATLIQDMNYCIKYLKTSVLMYPEASYSFDGRATPLPRGLGKLVKTLNVPVLMIRTYGAFTRDPLYNGLQNRKVKISAELSCLLSADEVKNSTCEQIGKTIDDAFTFDNFKWQIESGTETKEGFIADGLERILYKCAACKKEGKMVGKGTTLTCKACGKTYDMDSFSRLRARDGNTEFEHIPDWYSWQREECKKELERGEYKLDVPVSIGMMTDFKRIYMVGDGRLVHTNEGFRLTGCNGKLDYTHKPLSSYGLYADYLLYEIGDMVCIGDKNVQYYCFFKTPEASVAKTRIAAEELYKLTRARIRAARSAKSAEKPTSAEA